jgi:hypothetical protein
MASMARSAVSNSAVSSGGGEVLISANRRWGLFRLGALSQVVQRPGLQAEAVLVVGIIRETLFDQGEGLTKLAGGGGGRRTGTRF